MRKILIAMILFMLLFIPISQARPYYSSERYGCFEVTWKGSIGAVSQNYKVTIKELCGYNRYITPIFVIDNFYVNPNKIKVVVKYPKLVTEYVNETAPVKVYETYNYTQGDGVIFNPPILTKDDLVFHNNCYDNGDNQTFTCVLTNYTNQTVLKTLRKYYRVNYKRVDYSNTIVIYPKEKLYVGGHDSVTIRFKIKYIHVTKHKKRWVTGRAGVIIEGHLYHPWFNTSWSNRKLIVLNTTVGNSFAIRLNKYPEMQPDCSDIRVTALGYDLKEHDLPFTVLDCNNDSVIIAMRTQPQYIWDSASPNTIYVYYGNDNPPPRELPTSNYFLDPKDYISIGYGPSVALEEEDALYVANPNAASNKHVRLCKYYGGSSTCVLSTLYSRWYYALGIANVISDNSSIYVAGFYYNMYDGWYRWLGYVMKVNRSSMSVEYEASIFPITDSYPIDNFWVYDATLYNGNLILACRWQYKTYTVTDDKSMLVIVNTTSGAVIQTVVFDNPSQTDYFVRVFEVNGSLMAIRRVGSDMYLVKFNNSYGIVNQELLPLNFIDYRKASDGNTYLYFKDASIYKVNVNGTLSLLRQVSIPSGTNAIDVIFIANYPNAGVVPTTSQKCYYDYDVVWCSYANNDRAFFRQKINLNVTKSSMPYYYCYRYTYSQSYCFKYMFRDYHDEPITYHSYTEFIVNNTYEVNYSYVILNAVLNKSLDELSGIYVSTENPVEYLPFYVKTSTLNNTLLHIPIVNLSAGSVRTIKVFHNSSSPYVPHYAQEQYVYPIYLVTYPARKYTSQTPYPPLRKSVTASVSLYQTAYFYYYAADYIKTIKTFQAPFRIEITMRDCTGNWIYVNSTNHTIKIRTANPYWNYGQFQIYIDDNLVYSNNVFVTSEFYRLLIDLDQYGNLTIKFGGGQFRPDQFNYGGWIVDFSTNVSSDWLLQEYSLSTENQKVGRLSVYTYLPEDILIYGGEFPYEYVVDIESLNTPPDITIFSPNSYQFYNFPVLDFIVTDAESEYLYVTVELDNSTIYYNSSYVNGTRMVLDLTQYINMSVFTPHVVRVMAYDGTAVSYSDEIPFYYAPFEFYTTMKSDFIERYDYQQINLSTTLVNTTNFIIEWWYSDFDTTYAPQNDTVVPNCSLPWCNATYEIPCTQNSFVYFNAYVTNGTNTYKAGPFSYICGGLPASVGVTTPTPVQTAGGGLSPNTELDVKSFAIKVPEGQCVDDVLVVELKHDWFTYNATLKIYDLPSNMIFYPKNIVIEPGSNLIDISVCDVEDGDYAGRAVITLENGIQDSAEVAVHVRSFSQSLIDIARSWWMWLIILVGLVLWYKGKTQLNYFLYVQTYIAQDYENQ